MLEIEDNDHLDLEPGRDPEHIPDRITDVDWWPYGIHALVAERVSVPLYLDGMAWRVQTGHVISNEPNGFWLVAQRV